MTGLGLGFSPCPNDTFMFHALVHGRTTFGAPLRPVLLDIAALNARAASDDPLPLTKLSVAAYAELTDRYRFLRSGAALGRGCGPLVVRRPGGPASLSDLARARVAIPGRRTTAFALLRMFAPPVLEVVPMPFDTVMPAVARGQVDAGLIIHESRFTYPAHGLERVADLGTVWERETRLPLPLGLIAAHRDLDRDTARSFERALRRSIEMAMADPEASRPYIRAHAQEMAPEVCAQHIELYVNAYSVDVGAEGERAIHELLRRTGT